MTADSATTYAVSTDTVAASRKTGEEHNSDRRRCAISVVYPASPAGAGILNKWAELVRDAGLERLWLGQTTFGEPHQLFASLSGSGHPGFVGALTGFPQKRPLAALREYIHIVTGLLRGDAVDYSGEFHSMHGALGPVPGRKPDVSVGLGVLRPAAAALAGEIADVAITWLAPPSYLRATIIPSIREGEQRGTDSASTRTVAVVHICLDRPGREVLEWARATCGLHALLPHYTDMLRKAGFTVRGGDQDTNIRAIVDSGAFVYGSASEIADRLSAWHSAGVDEIVLNPCAALLSGGIDEAIKDCKEVIDAIQSSGHSAKSAYSTAQSST